MAWPLARKVSAALLGILAGTVATTGFFTYSKLQSVLSALAESRYGVVVYAVKHNAEDQLALGFPLRQLRPVQDVIDRMKVNDSRIRGIEVFDASGAILFDTDRGAIGASVPPAWVRAAAAAGNHPFAITDEEGRIVGLPLVDSLGTVDGGVVLRYPGVHLDDMLGASLGGLARQAGLVLAVFAALGVAGSYRLFGGVRQRLETMDSVLGTVLAEGADPLPEDEPASFETDFAGFAVKAHETIHDLEDAMQDVERLDRLA